MRVTQKWRPLTLPSSALSTIQLFVFLLCATQVLSANDAVSETKKESDAGNGTDEAAADFIPLYNPQLKVLIYIIIAIFTTLALVGLFGNIWVMYTVTGQLLGRGPGGGCSIRRAKFNGVHACLHSSAYIYLLLLSIVDLLSLCNIPLIVADLHYGAFHAGALACKVLFMFEAANKSLSPFILTALSIDRYIAVCHPTMSWMREARFALSTVIVSFIAALFFIAPITFDAQLNDMKDTQGRIIVKCSSRMAENDGLNGFFDIVQTLACYIVPLCVIVWVYMAILFKLYRHTRHSSVGRKTSISLSRVLKCSVLVVAFYFVCWTPYWYMRILFVVGSQSMAQSQQKSDDTEVMMLTAEEMQTAHNWQIFYSLLIHTLPYAQSAFNWLFYAFLNRNLRNQTQKCTGTAAARSNGSTFVDGTSTTAFTPLWKNLQQVGSQLKSAGIDTRNALLSMSPFRTRSRIQARGSSYLDASYAPHQLSTSLLEIPQQNLYPQMENNGRSFSYNDFATSNFDLKRTVLDSPCPTSDNSSVEWL